MAWKVPVDCDLPMLFYIELNITSALVLIKSYEPPLTGFSLKCVQSLLFQWHHSAISIESEDTESMTFVKLIRGVIIFYYVYFCCPLFLKRNVENYFKLRDCIVNSAILVLTHEFKVTFFNILNI
jgi:hypothetical protein